MVADAMPMAADKSKRECYLLLQGTPISADATPMAADKKQKKVCSRLCQTWVRKPMNCL